MTYVVAVAAAAAGLAGKRKGEVDVWPKGKIMTHFSICFSTEVQSVRILSQSRILSQ